MVRAVLFDLFETLITEADARPTRASSLGPQLGCDPEAFRAEWRARRHEVVVGRSSLHDVLSGIATRLGRQPEDATLRGICHDRSRAKPNLFERIEPEVESMISRLRGRGLRLGVVSNCFSEDVGAWAGCPLAPQIHCTVWSFEVGLAKPNPGIYLEATRRLGARVPVGGRSGQTPLRLSPSG
jgi:FMN phosphatase YigB (HAD superfamily)